VLSRAQATASRRLFHGRQQVFVWLVIVMSGLYLPDTRFVPQNRVRLCVPDH
jgi:hypothetical protein